MSAAEKHVSPIGKLRCHDLLYTFGSVKREDSSAELLATDRQHDPHQTATLRWQRNNLSSPSITLHAVSITQTSTSISGPVEDSGNANPDNDFRFDPALAGTGG